MIENEITLDLSELYSIDLLVQVHSAAGAFTEVGMRESAAVFNGNNGGKSSMLRTLKLFLLPEVNFKDIKKKFAFESGGKFYGVGESYRYYLPSEKSFIICECENPLGKFCQILYRSSDEYGYQRTFIRRSFDEIRYWFWDSTSKANEDLGEHTNITVSQFLEKVKGEDVITTSDQSQLREILYRRYTPGQKNTRFCVLPMSRNAGTKEVETLRSLLHLAFNISGGKSDSLPKAFATLVERELSTKKATIAVDLKALVEEYENLELAQTKNNKLRKFKPEWNTFTEHQLSFMKLRGQLRSSLSLIRSSVEAHKEVREEKLESLNERVGTAREAAQEAKSEHGRCHIYASNTDRSKDDLQRRVDALLGEVQAIEHLRRSHEALGLSNDDEIIDYIQTSEGNGIEALEKKIEARQSRDTKETRLRKLIDDESKLANTLKAIEFRLSNKEQLLLEGLDPHAANTLLSINEVFGQVIGEPAPSHQLVIDEFTHLFELTDAGYQFCGAPIDIKTSEFSSSELLNQLKDQESKLNNMLRECRGEMLDLRNELAGSEEFAAAALESLKSDLQEAKDEVELLKSSNRIFKDHQEESGNLEKVALELEQANEAVLKAENDWTTKQGKFQALNSELTTLQGEDTQLSEAERIIQGILGMSHQLIGDIGASTSEEAMTLNEIQQAISSLESNRTEMQQAHSQAMGYFQRLMREDFIDRHVEAVYKTSLLDNEVEMATELLRSQFITIDQVKREIDQKIETHNSHTSAQIAFVKQMGDAIKGFQNRLNDELGQIQISNLSAISIGIATHKQFDDLLGDLEKYNRHQETVLMQRGFYERLESFCRDYLVTDGGVGKLDVAKIIKGIDYTFELNGKIETAAQSNGTTAMLNSVLLSILMSRVIPDDVTMKLPIMFDEVGSLEKANLQTLLNAVESRNFTLFVANPENTGVISGVINKWHDLSWYLLSDAPAIANAECIYSQQVERLIELVEAEQEEGEMESVNAD